MLLSSMKIKIAMIFKIAIIARHEIFPLTEKSDTLTKFNEFIKWKHSKPEFFIFSKKWEIIFFNTKFSK